MLMFWMFWKKLSFSDLFNATLLFCWAFARYILWYILWVVKVVQINCIQLILIRFHFPNLVPWMLREPETNNSWIGKLFRTMNFAVSLQHHKLERQTRETGGISLASGRITTPSCQLLSHKNMPHCILFLT